MSVSAALDSFFLLRGGDPTLLLIGRHDPWLVLLSLAVAAFTSVMALQMAGMARTAGSGLGRQLSRLSGAAAMGGGIWSMHFIGMLAFQLCTTVDYQPGWTLLSLLPALLASWVALGVLARGELGRRQWVIGGVLVGAGIGAMHYMGMQAMRMSVALRYDPIWFATSIVVAVLLAMLALWIRFGLAERVGTRWALLLGGLVMGGAIAGMHYTAMAAARFVGVGDGPCEGWLTRNNNLALAITLVTLVASALVGGANGLLRYRSLYLRVREQQSRMNAMVDTAVDGIITIDGHGLVQSFNRAAERLFGWSAEEVLGRNVRMLMPEPEQGDRDGYLDQHLRTGLAGIVGVGREVQGLRRDGSLLPIRLAIGRVEVPGEPLFVGFITDLSERQRMETALRESERQHRSLMANSPGVTFRCRNDAQWSMLLMSEAMQALSGWPAEDFLSGRQSIAPLVHPGDRERVHQAVAAALAADEAYTLEYRLATRDGGERWVSETGRGVRDEDGGPVQSIDGVIIDITESKRRHAEFEGLARAVNRSLAVVEIDLQRRISWANEPFLNLTGYLLEELQGQPHEKLCRLPELQSEAYQQAWDRLMAGEALAGEYLRLGKHGRRVWIQASYTPVYDAHGQVHKITMLAQDISERRVMELDLREAKERAEAAAAAKSAFLANMSHEIRTPMNAILGFTELLLDTSLNEPQRKHLGTVRQSARSLLGLLNDILDTAKLEKGAVELEGLDFSLRAVCEQALASLRLGAERKGLVLGLDYPAGEPEFFHGDALRVQQVLVNLVGNAIKFTETGRVDLQMRLERGQIHLTVSDTGIGIAPDRLAHIFDPFAQADASTTRRFGGTGLGTTISRQLVERMGGRITVESTLGQGSHFHVWLPLPPGAPVAAPIEAPRVQLPALRLLVADDVAQNLELLQLLLGREGHEVVAVSDGLQAVQAFSQPGRAGRFDAVLMDVHMPTLDGLGATRRIRVFEQTQARLRTPIVALTASVLEEDRQAALAAGMDGFAVKPVEPERLFQELARVLGLRPAQTPVPPPAADAVRADALAVIDAAQGLRLWSQSSAWRRALRRFAEEQAEGVPRLQSLLQAGEWLEARGLAHRWRGVAGTLALPRLQQRAQLLEDALRLGRLEVLPALGAQLGDALDEVLAAIAELGAETRPAPLGAPVEGAVLTAALKQLEQALQHGELADAVLQTLQQQLPAERCAPLLRALDQFDFEAALAAVAELRASLRNT